MEHTSCHWKHCAASKCHYSAAATQYLDHHPMPSAGHHPILPGTTGSTTTTMSPQHRSNLPSAVEDHISTQELLSPLCPHLPPGGRISCFSEFWSKCDREPQNFAGYMGGPHQTYHRPPHLFHPDTKLFLQANPREMPHCSDCTSAAFEHMHHETFLLRWTQQVFLAHFCCGKTFLRQIHISFQHSASSWTDLSWIISSKCQPSHTSGALFPTKTGWLQLICLMLFILFWFPPPLIRNIWNSYLRIKLINTGLCPWDWLHLDETLQKHSDQFFPSSKFVASMLQHTWMILLNAKDYCIFEMRTVHSTSPVSISTLQLHGEWDQISLCPNSETSCLGVLGGLHWNVIMSTNWLRTKSSLSPMD